jgi:uncharacterized membrane protein
MNYNFKVWEEAAWAAVVAGILAVAQIVAVASPGVAETREFWVSVVLGAFVRAVGGALLSRVATSAQATPTPAAPSEEHNG